jgi:hypothetical protein
MDLVKLAPQINIRTPQECAKIVISPVIDVLGQVLINVVDVPLLLF